MSNIETIKKAYLFAEQAHRGQTDKAGKNYIFHPLAVASKLSSPDEKVLALLHDVVEDTSYTFADIEREFGCKVAETLDYLTHRDGESYDDYLNRLSSNALAVRVKMADLNHNMELTRLTAISEKDIKRFEKYAKAYVALLKKQQEIEVKK